MLKSWNGKSKIKKLKVTPKELEAFYRYKAKLNKTRVKYANRKDVRFGVTPSPHHVIVPRYKLRELPSETDYRKELKTIVTKKKEGGYSMTVKNKTLVANMQHVKFNEIPPLKGPDSQA